MFGIILINKESGRTSHDVVDACRRKFETRRVGHAGTLDPLATGLLVVAVGPATRFLQYLPLEPKEYVAEITFGIATTTYDGEGEVTDRRPVPEDLLSAIENVRPQFMGLISQLPPMFSAIKVGGKPLYHLARQGKEIAREPRNVHIDTLEINGISESVVRARIVCSGGTYIRSLAHDLGDAVGCGAFLSQLHRTRVGRFHVDQGKDLGAASERDLISLRSALEPMPMLNLSESQVHLIRDGRKVDLPSDVAGNLVALLDPDGSVFSVARVMEGQLQPECVIPKEAFHALS